MLSKARKSRSVKCVSLWAAQILPWSPRKWGPQLTSQLVSFFPRKPPVWSFQSPLPPLSNLPWAHVTLFSLCRNQWLCKPTTVWLKSKYFSYAQGEALLQSRWSPSRGFFVQVVVACWKKTSPHPNVFSQHRPKKPNKNLRCKGEFKNSLSALGAPRRLFLTAISRQDIDGAGLKH